METADQPTDFFLLLFDEVRASFCMLPFNKSVSDRQDPSACTPLRLQHSNRCAFSL
jgi:hypothetical protein